MQTKILITLVALDKLAKIAKISRGTLLSWLGHFTLSKYLYRLDKRYYFILTNNSREALYKYFLLKSKKKNDAVLESKLYDIKGFKRIVTRQEIEQ